MCYMLIIAALYLAAFFLANYDPKEKGKMNTQESNAGRDLFRASLNAVPAWQQRMADTDWFPAVHVSDTGEEYLLEFYLPGLKLEDIQISQDDSALDLNADPKTLRFGGKSLRCERPAGTFFRRLVLPTNAGSDEIHARLQDGVLELQVPRKMPPDENGKSNIRPFEEPHYEHTAS
jgi:HSP20 family protein